MEDVFDRFREAYGRDGGVLAEIEAAVTGAVYGANGYTTRRHADLLAERLALGPGRRLLDVGTGCGWPGIYLAETTGCDVVLTDVPFEGLRRAVARAHSLGLERAAVVASTGESPPFAAASFDAICSTDVLC